MKKKTSKTKSTAPIQPGPTLYLNNLVDDMSKEEMKKVLYFLFTQHGRVIDVIVKKGEHMRGQAHVVYQETSEATTAMRKLQGFVFYDKPMRIAYSRSKSQATRKLDAQMAEFLGKAGEESGDKQKKNKI